MTDKIVADSLTGIVTGKDGRPDWEKTEEQAIAAGYRPASDPLAVQSRLADIRLRVINRENVSTDEYRDLLMDLRRDRDATARSARSAQTAKRKASTVTPQTLDINTLFGKQ